MQTFHGPDGRVDIPDTRPGEIVTIQVAGEVEAKDEGTGPIHEEDAEAIKKRNPRRAEQTRKNLPEPWRSADQGDLLYGDDRLPR